MTDFDLAFTGGTVLGARKLSAAVTVGTNVASGHTGAMPGMVVSS